MDFDVVVVGGGPAGSFTASNIAKNGYKVLVAEEHKRIGEPVQCAGLVSPRTHTLASAPEDIVLREFKGARIVSALGGELLVNGEKTYALAVDRAAFDRHLAGQAREAGAEIITGSMVTGLSKKLNGYSVSISGGNSRMSVECRLLIGADGVQSRVARWLGLQPAGRKISMYAGEFDLGGFDPGEVTILLGQSFAPGWFGWIVPLSGKTGRVGVGSFLSDISPRQCLKRMIDAFPSRFRKYKELRYTGGSVPFGAMRKIYSSHAMLVGDAAAQVKPMSGGGLYTGLRGSLACARVACEALSQGRLDEKFLSRYQAYWDVEFGAEFRTSVSHREVYMNMKETELDKLLRFLDRPHWRRMIARHGDIDYPSWLARRLFRAGPWLQKFALAAVDMMEGKLKHKISADV